ncbi:zinc ribbon domain-containing protein [Bacillaceae bacterium SIJ1]|uniref:zinc ribbon domain-containing protein n=1 Tax=Litoribacterium kuwaitense TaxID=1398745 RepID=UPI0013ECDF67|nr:zinc ribbon domain-containing protein [Litoribacterium kuwaitense]NGP45405.1 zinc ribbon domain-containing protein [Litoribacterium kuwaitense]
MICPYCGKENTDDVTACSRCGRLLQSHQIDNDTMDQEQVDDQTLTKEENTTFDQQQTVKNHNPYVEKGKKTAKHYGQFLSRVFRAPLTTAQQLDKNDMINGVISIVVFALLYALSMSAFFTSIDFFDPGFVTGFLKPFIFILLFAALSTLAIWLISLLQNANVDFLIVIARLGALSSVSSALLILSLLALVIQSVGIFTILLLFSLFSFILAACFILVSFKTKGSPRMDYFYAILLLAIFQFVLFSRLLNDYISNLFMSML